MGFSYFWTGVQPNHGICWELQEMQDGGFLEPFSNTKRAAICAAGYTYINHCLIHHRQAPFTSIDLVPQLISISNLKHQMNSSHPTIDCLSKHFGFFTKNCYRYLGISVLGNRHLFVHWVNFYALKFLTLNKRSSHSCNTKAFISLVQYPGGWHSRGETKAATACGNHGEDSLCNPGANAATRSKVYFTWTTSIWVLTVLPRIDILRPICGKPRFLACQIISHVEGRKIASKLASPNVCKPSLSNTIVWKYIE